MDYPAFIKRHEDDEHPAAFVQNEAEHRAQLIGWHGHSDQMEKKPKVVPAEESAEAEEVAEPTKEELQAILDKRGIAYKKNLGVAKLKALVEESE